MRADESETVVISGPAGSGKTNILLHRLDYFVKRKGIPSGECALFCFDVGLKKYLAESAELVLSEPPRIYSIGEWVFDALNELVTNRLERTGQGGLADSVDPPGPDAFVEHVAKSPDALRDTVPDFPKFDLERLWRRFREWSGRPFDR